MTQRKLPIREKFFNRDEKVDSTPTIENFIAKGFFPKELVPAFTTEKLADNIHQLVNNAENPHRKDSKCCHYSFPKIKHHRRTLGIPNPLHQIKLCQNLVSNWTDINRLLMSGNLSKSIPSIGSQKRAASPPLVQLPNERAIQSAGSRYRLYADISRYYSTIYTHSISWAIHGKSQAKANFKIKKSGKINLYGDSIDECVRNTQDRQSIGIPIGPDSSLVIAEIIGTAMDNMLREFLGYKPIGFRFIDDYYLYFDTFSEAEHTLSQLHKIL